MAETPQKSIRKLVTLPPDLPSLLPPEIPLPRSQGDLDVERLPPLLRGGRSN